VKCRETRQTWNRYKAFFRRMSENTGDAASGFMRIEVAQAIVA
jgi:hypothetical protein